MRLFIAINIPDEIRDMIWDNTACLRDRRYPVKWVKSDAMHITVKFLGEVPAQREGDVKQSLRTAAAGVKQFTLSLRGVGAFPNVKRPKVLWVGCDQPQPMHQLQRQVDLEMSKIGFERESRAFHPHVTLGRVRRGAGSSETAGISSILDGIDCEAAYPVESIELMKSELTPAGAKYAIRESIGLER